MQACPYDAIYIDKDTNTAAKCNFCAHRIDEGYEPACVVVCPTHSIWVGDLSDPTSGISKLVNTNPVTVRAPGQNTGPNVFSLGADRAVLDPLMAPVDDSYIFSTPDAHRAMVSSHLPPSDDNAKTTLNTPHPRPWGWRVTTYLWTKGVAAGVLLVMALAVLLDNNHEVGRYQTVWAPLIALVGVAATGVLLIWDLKRPERFWYIFAKGNRTSWLFLGSLALAAFGAIVSLWLVAGGFAEKSNNSDSHRYDLVDVLTYVSIPAAVMLAGYTAFLFAQAEGRDLWQSKLLFPHLLVQAVMVGAGVLAIVYGKHGDDPSSPFRFFFADDAGPGNTASPLLAAEGGFNVYTPSPDGPHFGDVIIRCLVVAVVVHIAFAIVEFYGKHETKQATAAAHLATRGQYKWMFRGSLALALIAAGTGAFAWNGDHTSAAIWAGILVQVALLAYESVFIRAGQDVPLS
jgi:hypothetical protein